MSDVTLCGHPQNSPKTSPHDNTNFNYEGSYLSSVICNIVDKADFGRSTPQMHHGIYIMGCIWQPFWILQEKVGISFYFWIIRLVNTQLALYSHVTCNPLDTPNTSETPPKHPNMTITNLNYEGSYLSGIICNIVVIAHFGRSTPMHHGIYIMGCIWQPFWILQEKMRISFYFWIIRLVNSQLALYSHVRCNPLWHPQNSPKTPPHENYKFQLWELIFVQCNM